MRIILLTAAEGQQVEEVIERAVSEADDDRYDGLYAKVVMGSPWADALMADVKDALEGESNDAEHDALAAVADALGIEYEDPYA